MAILGITNRTENWKTARHFAPLFGANSVRLARRLLATEEERARLQPGDVRLELFWVGMRDYFDFRGIRGKERATERGQIARAYRRLFPRLRKEVGEFEGYGESAKLKFQALTDANYSAAQEAKLASNLLSTELDIILESPRHLFIGEAKHHSTFGANGRDVLTHQLIRQYVMAKILVEHYGPKRAVIPFVVGDDRAYLEKTLQVQFMVEQKWMREENVLEWSDIEALW